MSEGRRKRLNSLGFTCSTTSPVLNQSHCKAILPEDFTPSPYSVICGRGEYIFRDAIGNRRLAVFASMFLSRYSKASCKEEKTGIVSEIMETVKSACPDPSGAFIKYWNGRWWEVDVITARKKIGVILRNFLHDKYKSSLKSKLERRRQCKALQEKPIPFAQPMGEERRKRLKPLLGSGIPFPGTWEFRFQELVEYKRIHRNSNYPWEYKLREYTQLGSWVHHQRRSKETMSEERRKRLDSIGFSWNTSLSLDVRFQHLVEQRTKKERMLQYERNQLNSIGFKTRRSTQRIRPWTVEDPKRLNCRSEEEAAKKDTVIIRQAWDSSFEQLREFVRKYKHCNVPAHHPEIGKWAEKQRRLYERKQIVKETPELTDEMEAKLLAVGFLFARTSSEDEGEDWSTAFPSPIPNETFFVNLMVWS